MSKIFQNNSKYHTFRLELKEKLIKKSGVGLIKKAFETLLLIGKLTQKIFNNN